MLDSLRIIIDETLEIYNLATLDGKLFIPFAICLVYLLLSPAGENDRLRKYLVYPSLVLMFFLFNPVFIHLLYKYIEIPERIVRMYWPLPIDFVIVACLIHAFSAVKGTWKKSLVLIAAAFVLLLNTGGSLAGAQSYGKAENEMKLPKGTKEVSDTIFTLNGGADSYVILPEDLFFWIREYNPSIRLPYIRDMDMMYTEAGEMDLDAVGQAAIDGGCGYVVLTTARPSVGQLEDYGFEQAAAIDGQDCQYLIYQLK